VEEEYCWAITGDGKVMLKLIRFRCVGVRISTGLWSETWSVILSEEDRLTVFEKEEDTGLWA